MTGKSIPIEQWGKDHWSLLAYVETCCVDDKGRLNGDYMRINYSRHPVHPPKGRFVGDENWNEEHGTRLKGYWKKDGKTKDQSKKLTQHDDMDCLEDLEADGCIEIISMVNGFVSLTKKGREICNRLREFKQEGGMFADFQYLQQQKPKKRLKR